MSNYPDDIRSYDHYPHSPFYVNPNECPECGESSLEGDKWEGHCTNPDCDYSWDNLPDPCDY